MNEPVFSCHVTMSALCNMCGPDGNTHHFHSTYKNAAACISATNSSRRRNRNNTLFLMTDPVNSPQIKKSEVKYEEMIPIK